MLDGINFILENNSFCFNDIYFLQTKDTAMVTKFAPIYATLVLTYLEEKMYQESEKALDSDLDYLETNFKRFLDECFLIFKQSEEDLKKFYDLLKGLHPSIRFTLDKSRQQLSFLRVKVPFTSSLSVYPKGLTYNLNDWLVIKDMLVFAFNLLNLLLIWMVNGGKWDLLFPSAFWMNFKIMYFLMKILGNTPSADSAKMQHEVFFFFFFFSLLILLMTH